MLQSSPVPHTECSLIFGHRGQCLELRHNGGLHPFEGEDKRLIIHLLSIYHTDYSFRDFNAPIKLCANHYRDLFTRRYCVFYRASGTDHCDRRYDFLSKQLRSLASCRHIIKLLSHLTFNDQFDSICVNCRRMLERKLDQTPLPN
jgi:hypothetical protein